VAHGLQLAREGADLIDVGGESTRPGAAPVSVDEEIARVAPVVRSLAGELRIPVSVDTRKPEVASAALEAGARWVNDVGGLRDPRMLEVAAAHRAGVVILHMQGEPDTMQLAPRYDDVIQDVRAYLDRAAQLAIEGGIAADRIWIDPGIGFGKTLGHNLELLANLDRFAELGYPVVLGASRKSFIGRLSRDTGEDRLAGSLAAAGAAMRLPRAVVRVHDVAATRQYLLVRHSIQRGRPFDWPRPDATTPEVSET
jgi:dihydropteroate synthase